MRMVFTNEMIFSFGGPNFCLLGSEEDFKELAKLLIDLTSVGVATSFSLSSLQFIHDDGEKKEVFFSSEKDGKFLGVLQGDTLLFELDPRFWERLFKYFVLMSWDKGTYYLNYDESYLSDLDLVQECNFICSSGF